MIKLKPSMHGNRYSQSGEESAIREALHEIQKRKGKSGWLVEFGGSRGRDNSNLMRFAEEGENLLLIEADANRFADLEDAIAGVPTARALRARVGFSDNDNLKNLLALCSIEVELVQVVSIDIDSDDAAVFENLRFVPDMVIVEFNPTLASDARFRNPTGSQIGNSIGELRHVAANASMFPVAITSTNLIFMRNEYKSTFVEIEIESEISNLDLTRFGLGYDGTIVRYSTNGKVSTSEVMHNGWNGSLILQPLPRFLRKFTNPRLPIRAFYFVFANILFSPWRVLSFLRSASLLALNDKKSKQNE